MPGPTDTDKLPVANDASSATPPPSPAFYQAASLLSIWGPCRSTGDAYLSCVVTAGMGMCKPLRRNFEQCATETSEYSTMVLDQLAMQACGHVDESSSGPTVAKRNCAADFLLQQQQMQQQQMNQMQQQQQQGPQPP